MTQEELRSSDIEVDYKNESALNGDLIRACREEARDDDIRIVVVNGGITNLLYRLEWGEQKRLIRIYGENTDVIIDRERDTAIFHELSKREFSPRLYGVFRNGRVEQWLDMRPLEPQEMGQREPVDFPPLIAAQVARMHNLDIPGRDEGPQLWQTLSKWRDMVADVSFAQDQAKTKALNALDRPGLAAELDTLRTLLPSPDNGFDDSLLSRAAGGGEIAECAARFACDTVFAHNDLLSGNILFKEGTEEVQLLDYEYGCYNLRAFDWANHFCEYAGFDSDFDRWYPSTRRQIVFLDAYVRAADRNLYDQLEAKGELDEFFRCLVVTVNRFALASHYFWGYWAILQARYSPIDFDFIDYARLRFEGYRMHKTKFID